MPLLRKRLPLPRVAMQTVAFAAPLGLCVAVRRSRARDVATCALQMWAYLMAYKTPHDDEAAQAARVHLAYPIAGDRLIGLGELPSIRLQRAFARLREDGRPHWRVADAALVWTHWSWFLVPHCALLFILARDPRRFERAAVMTYAVFDVGASFYWVIPTAPPWYAAGASEMHADGEVKEVRRVMVEYGEHFWGGRWSQLYSVFGGNPLAAMPSLHFATSVMAALLLSESSPAAGAVASAYTATLGFALVYLGEHYLVDLLGGLALTLAVRRAAPRAGPLLARLGAAVAALERIAHEEPRAA